VQDLNRFPTWIVLLAAIASVIAVIGRYIVIDRGANPRRLWLMLLGAWLAVTGVGALGILRTRTGQRITPNQGLLVLADEMAGLLVISIPLARAAHRLTVSELRQLRSGDAVSALFGRHYLVKVIALMLGPMAILLAGEIALAAELPAPPAVVACRDYTTWILAPANAGLPPRADQAILTHASRVAPPGHLANDLNALAADVGLAIRDVNTMQRILDEARVVSDEKAVSLDCKSVPATG